jgi:hypothetical protein
MLTFPNRITEFRTAAMLVINTKDTLICLDSSNVSNNRK